MADARGNLNSYRTVAHAELNSTGLLQLCVFGFRGDEYGDVGDWRLRTKRTGGAYRDRSCSRVRQRGALC
jgi:hypothetical protein